MSRHINLCMGTATGLRRQRGSFGREPRIRDRPYIRSYCAYWPVRSRKRPDFVKRSAFSYKELTVSIRRKAFAVVWVVAFIACGVWLEAHRRDVASLICFFAALWGPWVAAATVESHTEEREEDPLSRLKW
jgi:hypothetical protein